MDASNQYNYEQNRHRITLNITDQNNLNGRDALIIANFMTNKIPTVLTHDQALIATDNITWKNFHITFKDPLNKN